MAMSMLRLVDLIAGGPSGRCLALDRGDEEVMAINTEEEPVADAAEQTFDGAAELLPAGISMWKLLRIRSRVSGRAS